MTVIRFALAVLFSLATFTTAAADKTDLWWNPNESGWGMTIANQGETIFVTLYVYGADNNPTWFVGPGTLLTQDAQGIRTYGGDLFRVTGPFYASSTFDPNTVNATKVGTYTYRELTATTGLISYTVNGVTVTKNVQRQTLAVNPYLTGLFGGAYFSTVTGCSNSANNGPLQTFITMTVSASGTSRTMQISYQTQPFVGTVCTASGTYAQAGRFGSITGTWTCNLGGISGTSTVTEIEGNGNTFTARFENKFSGCTETGYLTAARVFGG